MQDCNPVPQGRHSDRDFPDRELTGIPKRAGECGGSHGCGGRKPEDVSGGVALRPAFNSRFSNDFIDKIVRFVYNIIEKRDSLYETINSYSSRKVMMICPLLQLN
jgi:hypothetical protein